MSQSSLTKFFKRPGVSLSSPAAPAAKRAKYASDTVASEVNSPSPEISDRAEKNRQAALERRQSAGPSGLGSSWKRALSGEFTKPYFTQLQAFVESERKSHTIYPPEADVYSWSNLCRASDVKVVILGQDPYHGPNQAHGLCFSVRKGQRPPPSLVNMFIELERSVGSFKRPNHGDLSTWAQQGVLLLNNVLTVRAHNANSHQGKDWEKFTDAVIGWLNRNLTGVVFLLWGRNAQTKGKYIDKGKHHILTAVHPSPLSAHRGFIGCNHFVRANELLAKQGKSPIEWTSICDEKWTMKSAELVDSPLSSQSSGFSSSNPPLTPKSGVGSARGGLVAGASPTAACDPTQD